MPGSTSLFIDIEGQQSLSLLELNGAAHSLPRSRVLLSFPLFFTHHLYICPMLLPKHCAEVPLLNVKSQLSHFKAMLKSQEIQESTESFPIDIRFFVNHLESRTFFTDINLDLQFYLKTGTCKFGSTCKFHHPRDKAGGILGKTLVNKAGYPLRLVCILKIFSFLPIAIS